MKHDLFISYSRVDSAFALQLVGDLRSRGIETWLDQLDIPPGASWDNEIEKALDQAKTMIVVLSSVSAKSENVKNEIGAALERNKQIVPVMLVKGTVPLMINRLQREDFSGDYAPALEKLVHRLSGGSRTGSLRAISPQDVERVAKAASARLASSSTGASDDEAGAPRSKAGLKALLNEQFTKLDKNGDGILTQDELAGLHGESQPDSLSPVSAAPRQKSGPSPKSRRMLFLGAGLAVLGVGLVLALGADQAPQAASPPLPPDALAAADLAAIDLAAVDEAPAPSLPPEQPEVAPAEESPAGRPRTRLNPARARVVSAGQAATDAFPVPTQQFPSAPSENVDPTNVGGAEGMPAALVCSDVGFGGHCQALSRRMDLTYSEIGNDSMSSLGLGTCRAVKVCSDIEFGGVCQVFRRDQPDLSATRVGNDSISSMECVVPGTSTASAARMAPTATAAPEADPTANAPTEYVDSPSP